MWIRQWLREKNNESLTEKLEKIQLKNEIKSLHEIIRVKDTLIDRLMERQMIDPEMGDPEPKDVEKRTMYVSAVAGTFNDIFHPKLKQMIAAGQHMLEGELNTRDTDLQIKGMLYAYREFIRWGNQMVSEYKSYTVDKKN